MLKTNSCIIHPINCLVNQFCLVYQYYYTGQVKLLVFRNQSLFKTYKTLKLKEESAYMNS